MGSLATAGSVTRVNQVTEWYQYGASVQGLEDGGWIVAWQGEHDIYQRRFDSAGNATGPEQIVNLPSTQPYQIVPQISELDDGGWLVSWSTYMQEGLYLQRYTADGHKAGHQVVIHTVDPSSPYSEIYQYYNVTTFTNGDWLVTWNTTTWNEANQNISNIHLQKFDASGNAIGGSQTIQAPETQGAINCDVITLADGGYLATWTEYSDANIDDMDVHQQRFTADGIAVIDDSISTLVHNPNSGLQIGGASTALDDGGWVVTWTSDEFGASQADILQQRFDATGEKVGSEQHVNTITTGSQQYSEITNLKGGGWVVVWETETPEHNGGIFQQRFDAQGNFVGGQTRVNASTIDHITDPDVTGLEDGSWIVTWTEYDYNGSGLSEVMQRHFAPDRSGTIANNLITGTAWSEKISGLAGNDTLRGAAGADNLFGGTGNDRLYGGSGKDRLYGEAGADMFYFGAGETGKTVATADVIYDFRGGLGDRINLSAIDAKTGITGNQWFKFIGDDAFSGAKGELRFIKAASDTFIYGDTNGDRTSDIVIRLDDAMSMKADYFIL